MIKILFFSKNTRYIFLTVVVVVGVLFFLKSEFNFWIKKVFSQEAYLQEKKQDARGLFFALNYDLKRLMKAEGVDVAVDVVHKGLLKNDLNINDCHRLLHLAGHYAYRSGETDFKKIARTDSRLCGHAYQHGVEAEISLRSSDPVRDLHSFCEATRQLTPGVTCFHGVGHEQMKTLQDVSGALTACDKLGVLPADDMTDCYKGVFSELAFSIEGVDGDTGLPLSEELKSKFKFEHPLDYCAELETKYHVACGSQLSRILYDGRTPEEALQMCVKDKYSLALQAACVRIISAVIAQGLFAKQDFFQIPEFVLKWQADLKRAYVEGVAGEYWALANSGIYKNQKALCSAFEQTTDESFCLSMMGGLKND